MSDVVWQALIAAVLAVVMAWMNQRIKASTDKAAMEAAARDKAAAEDATIRAQAAAKRDFDAAKKVQEVKADLKIVTDETHDKLDAMADVGVMTHTLVNSNMGTLLEAHKIVTRRLAEVTGNPADILAADLAERLWKGHTDKQEIVDKHADAQREKSASALE